MTDNPFDLFVDKSDKYHPVPTELSDEDFSELSDEELIERTNTLSLTTAYMEVNGVKPLKNMFDILLDIAHHPYIDNVNDESVIDWGPKEIAELKLTVGQLKGLLDLIWKYGVCPCLESCRDLQIYLWEVLQLEAHKRGYWDRGAYDTTVIEGRWMHFPKEKKIAKDCSTCKYEGHENVDTEPCGHCTASVDSATGKLSDPSQWEAKE